MSQSNILKNFISSLTDPELDVIAKLYLSEVDNIENIINCNSPYDSGIDFRAADFDSS